MTQPPDTLDAMAAQVAAHPDYRVLRRLDPNVQRAALSGPTVRRAAIVDTETTGTEPASDRVIELAIVVFEYCHATGTVGRVLDIYDGLEDPGRPIPPESTAIHGITDAMVAGQRIDDARVAQLLEGVGVVIAHNAGFDRRFLEPRLPLFASLPWACSWQEVPWATAGIASSKLEYLAYRCGFFYEGHRAEADCHALLHVLAQPFGTTGEPALKLLLDSARGPSYKVWASNSPYETKDVLKQRGYRWDAARRCWSLDVRSQEAVQEAVEWMRESVYAGRSVEVEIDEFDAKCRYSIREGRRSRLRTA
ncbi:MAG: 3'-5' exonuclease [Gammaproteobacteria bacterium]|nr:3'-5' exonuclease [Gammaproteobacteria bacterium]MDH5226452.1 3'-5' exonuclease [Gammaproteobacteria bacterium]